MSLDDSSTDLSRRKMLTLAGGSAAVGLAGCSALTSDDDDDGENESNGDGNGNGGGDDPLSIDNYNAQKAQDAWETVVENPDQRPEAYIEIEEATRDDMVILPLFFQLDERFWWDYVDVSLLGTLGSHHQKHIETELTNGDSELNLITEPFNVLDPIQSTDVYSSGALRLMYEGLVAYPDGVPEIQNDLLVNYEVSDDELTYTFEIEEGVQFHNGTELTASDIVYSWRRTVESDNSERANFTLNTPDGLGIAHETDDEGSVVQGSLALEVIDDYTFEMELAAPNPDALDILTYTSFYVLPEGIIGDVEGYDGEVDHNELMEESFGTGPFTLDSFTVGENIRVEEFANYHGTQPSVDSVHKEIIGGSEGRWTYGAIEGNADIFPIPTTYYDPDAIDAETDDRDRNVGTYGPAGDLDEEVSYLGQQALSVSYFGMNAANVPKAGRQAVAYVTNHEELITEVYANRGVEAYSFTPPSMWPEGSDNYQSWIDEWPYGVNETDIEAATQVLEEAGYSEDDPLQVTMTHGEGQTATREAVELTRDKLAGTPMEIEINAATFTDLISSGEDGALDIYGIGWGWSWISPAYGLFGLEPENTDTSTMPTETNGYYLDWQTYLGEDE